MDMVTVTLGSFGYGQKYLLLYNAKNMSSKSSWYIAKEGSDEMDPKKRVMTVSLIIRHLNSCDSRTLGDLGECG